MKAITLIPGTTILHLIDRPEPEISVPDEVSFKSFRWAFAARTARKLLVIKAILGWKK